MAHDDDVGPGTLHDDVRQAGEELNMVSPPYHEQTLHELPMSMREGTLRTLENTQQALADATTQRNELQRKLTDAERQTTIAVAALDEFKGEVDEMKNDISTIKMNAELLKQENKAMRDAHDSIAFELGHAMNMLRAIERATLPGTQGIEGACRALTAEAMSRVQKAIADAIDARDVDIPF